MTQSIFIAIRKDGQTIMSGQKGQYAFGDKASLGRSIAYSYQHEARKKGVKAAELYSVHEIEVAMLLPRKDESLEKLDKILYHIDTEDLSDPKVWEHIQSDLISYYNERKGF